MAMSMAIKTMGFNVHIRIDNETEDEYKLLFGSKNKGSRSFSSFINQKIREESKKCMDQHYLSAKIEDVENTLNELKERKKLSEELVNNEKEIIEVKTVNKEIDEVSQIKQNKTDSLEITKKYLLDNTKLSTEACERIAKEWCEVKKTYQFGLKSYLKEKNYI